MRRTNDFLLKDIIKDLLQEYRLSDKVKEIQIMETWPKVVGKVIAKHTTGIYYRNKKLYVTLNNAALREELNFAKTKLVKSLHKQAGENFIDEIIFK